MAKSRLLLLFSACVFFTNSVWADTPSIEDPTLRLDIEQTDKVATSGFIKPALPRDMELSDAARRNFRPILDLAPDRKVRLPLPLDFEVSQDRETIIQFGDPLFRMHPQRFDIYWIGDDGKVRNSVTNEFDGSAQAALSTGGFLAVAGGAFLSEVEAGEPKPKQVRLYDPGGKIVAETQLDASRSLTHLIPIEAQRGVVFTTVPSKAPLTDNQLFVLIKDEARQVDLNGIGIVQKVVALEKSLTFVQGDLGFGLIDLSEGKVLWKVPEKIRLVGPKAVTLSKDARQLLVMTGERISTEAIYRWTLSVFATESGKGLAKQKIDGEAPGTSEDVFAEVTGDTALIRFGAETRKVTIRRR